MNITFQDSTFFDIRSLSYNFWLNNNGTTERRRCDRSYKVSGDPETESKPSDRLFWLTFILLTYRKAVELWTCNGAYLTTQELPGYSLD